MAGYTKGQVKLFAGRATSFMLILILIDFVTGGVMRLFYFSQENKYTYAIEKTNAEVIILGSSRALYHYIPSIIEDTLGLDCFNTGSGGQNIYYHYGIINSILARYTPKIVILDLTDIDYLITSDAFNTDKLSILLPYYDKYAAISEVINLRGHFEKVKLLSKTYPFNSQIYSTVNSFIKAGNNPFLSMDGYFPLYGKIKDPLKVEGDPGEFDPDPVKISYLQKIISECKDKGIRLIIINSPSFVYRKGKPLPFDLIKEIGNDYAIEVWDFTNDTIFLKQEYFHDPAHLNDLGAHEFTDIIAGKIKRGVVYNRNISAEVLKCN
jgi:hypothetical protein